MSTKQQRYYQLEAEEAVNKALDRHVINQMLVMSGGCGKTFTSAKIVKNKGRVLWGTHTAELIEQSAIALLAERDLMPYDELLFTINSHDGIINLLQNVKAGNLFSDPRTKLISDNIGIIKADLFDIDKPIVMASMQTLHRRLHLIPPDHFDVVVGDECFPAGTMIDNVPIEEIKVGDTVRSFNHDTNQVELKKVVRLFKNEIKTNLLKVKLSNGIEFICTDNHPIYTQEYGYVTAKFISESVCDKEMSCLYLPYGKKQKANRISNDQDLLFKMRLLWNRFRRYKSKDILQKSMFTSMPKHIEKTKKKGLYSQLQNLRKRSKIYYKSRESKVLCWNSLLFTRMLFNKKKSRHEVIEIENRLQGHVRKNEDRQPDVETWNKREDDQINAGQNISFKRWKRRKHQTSNNDVSSNWIRYGVQHSNLSGQRDVSEPTNLLQSRSWSPGSKISNRSGWKDSQTKEVEISGQKENRDIEFVRVDSCEIYQRGSRGKCSKVCEKSYVYNFEVEDNHNYFVENTLVHNCHLYMAQSFKKSLDHFKPKLRLLLTATPHRLDGMPLSDICDEIVYEYGIEKGIADGFLCELEAIQIKTNTNVDTVKTTAGELNQKDLQVVINTPERNRLIVDKYIEYASGRQFIAYCVDVKHAQDLCQEFKDRGLNVELVVGDEEITPERKKVINDFKSGKYIGLVNVQILVAGFDHPNTSCVIQACPTKSLTKYIQSTVRGSRLKDESVVSKFGQNCIILDFIDVTTRHKLVNTWSLDKGKPTMERVFMSKQKKLAIMAEIEQKRKAMVANIKHDKKVNLLKIPEVVFSQNKSSNNPATEKQLNVIAQHGFDIINNSYTNGMCNVIISGLPASQKQINFLRWKGYDTDSHPGLTYGEFQLALDEIKKKEDKQLKQDDSLPF